MKKLLTLLTFLSVTGIAVAQDVSASGSAGNKISPLGTTYSISPIRITEENIGVGIAVEKFFDDNDIISLYVPFTVSFSPNGENDNAYYYRSGDDLESVRYKKEFYHFAPGIKIYPTGAFKKVSYALGVNLVAGIGRVRAYNRFYNVTYVPYKRELASETTSNLSRFKVGAMLFNSVNVRPTERFYLGVEFGLGYTYINRIGGESNGSNVLVQLGVNFGLAY